MSAPNNHLRIPQVFPPIIIQPQAVSHNVNLTQLEEIGSDGSEWSTTLANPEEVKEADDHIEAQRQYDEEADKQLAEEQRQIAIQYRMRLFKNVLDGSIPQGKGKK